MDDMRFTDEDHVEKLSKEALKESLKKANDAVMGMSSQIERLKNKNQKLTEALEEIEECVGIISSDQILSIAQQALGEVDGDE